ncbi:carbonic anhydrase 1-like [Musca autumnalis]|uniref:carbonic anhydrase 1-like n=1 Tax=Musca autumnalis TaxID=221902 RepID=UPI003CF2BCA5
MNKCEKFNVFKILQVICLIFIFRISNSFCEVSTYPSTSRKCIGKHQMPLNETNLEIREKSWEPFAFDNFDVILSAAELKNSEDNLFVEFSYEDGRVPIIYGGPLKEYGNFTLARIYWHWLEKSQPQNDLGAIKFPVALHLIFYDTKYESLDVAGEKGSTIIALAFSFKVVRTTELPFFIEIVQLLQNLRMPDTFDFLPFDTLPSVADILKGKLGDYYSYHGTTYSTVCLNDVLWFEFMAPLEIGVDFVQQMGYLEASDGTPLMEKLNKHYTPQGPVIKSFGSNGVPRWNMMSGMPIFFITLIIHLTRCGQ